MKSKFVPAKGVGLVKRIFNFWYYLFRNNHPIKDFMVYYNALRISIKKWLTLRGYEVSKENFLGYSVFITNYTDLRSYYFENFVQKTYLFTTKNKRPIIIDCGSNMGLTVLFFKHIYKKAKIVAFEPHKHTFTLLKKNIQNNKLKDIEVVNTALSNKIGSTTLYFPDVNGSGVMSINSTLNSHKFHKEKVKTTLLSKYIEKSIDLLKLDIEGSEGIVIKELDKSKKLKYVRNIIMEYHHNYNKNNNLADILSILKKNNFSFEIMSNKDHPIEFMKNKASDMLIYAFRN